MAKSSPEKLAAALRANLKRRKQAPGGQTGPEAGPVAKPAPRPGGSPPNTPQKPPKNSA